MGVVHPLDVPQVQFSHHLQWMTHWSLMLLKDQSLKSLLTLNHNTYMIAVTVEQSNEPVVAMRQHACKGGEEEKKYL